MFDWLKKTVIKDFDQEKYMLYISIAGSFIDAGNKIYKMLSKPAALNDMELRKITEDMNDKIAKSISKLDEVSKP